MNVKGAIERRRSIRKYADRPVSARLIEKLIRAVALAPSGCNARPWRFFLVQTEEAKNRLRSENAFIQGWVYKAPAIIVCCVDPDCYKGEKSFAAVSHQFREGTLPADKKALADFLSGKDLVRTIRDVAIASALMVLRATELGLGTCYVGLIRPEVVKRVLSIPDRYTVPFVLTVGYPAETPQAPKQTEWSLLLEGKC